MLAAARGIGIASDETQDQGDRGGKRGAGGFTSLPQRP